jgi:hypothetical protein
MRPELSKTGSSKTNRSPNIYIETRSEKPIETKVKIHYESRNKKWILAEKTKTQYKIQK